MPPTAARQRLAFTTRFGRFTITPDIFENHTFTLHMFESTSSLPLSLGRFRSINDALLSVIQQDTGYAPWDGLATREMPYKVHDLTCWKFEEFFGTKDLVPLS